MAQDNLPDGWVVAITPANTTHTVVVKHAAGGTGAFSLATGADFTMDATGMWLLVHRQGTVWTEIGRFYGATDHTFVTVSGGTSLTFGTISDGNLLKRSGTSIVGITGAALKSVQVFTANGTWTRPSGIRRVIVEVIGGGGAGGGAAATGASQAAVGGGGGS